MLILENLDVAHEQHRYITYEPMMNCVILSAPFESPAIKREGSI